MDSKTKFQLLIRSNYSGQPQGIAYIIGNHKELPLHQKIFVCINKNISA
ncbi:MAG: hypothetical protein KAI83_12630 [Thiomargarita sp.]|nr:hypothetical protein [Thiomargarita sp.]